MPIWGVDIHPQYQAGMSIEQIRAEGFDFMACKVSEARAVFDSQDWLRRGKAAGLLCLGYHYLRPGDEPGQAAVFAKQLARAGVPGMLDAEALASDGKTPTLSIDGVRSFLDATQAAGGPVPLLYLPRWYWDRLGRPSLAGLPPLWASRYVGASVPSAAASVMYESSASAGWDSYGGGAVAVLQFTNRAVVAGRQIDADAFLGTRDQFAALIQQEDPLSSPWDYVLPDPYPHAQPKSAGLLLGWAAAHAAMAKEQAIANGAQIAALSATVAELTKAIAADQDIDPDALIARVDETVRAAMADTVHVDVAVHNSTADPTA